MSRKTTLSLPEVAALLKCGWRTAYDLVLAGQLEGELVRGRWRITETSVRRVLAERASAEEPSPTP